MNRRDEKNRLIILKKNAFENLKEKEKELNICEKQLAILMLEKQQNISIDSKINLV